MSTSQVPVYLLISDAESEKARKVYSLFAHPLFARNMIDISPKKSLQGDDKLSLKDKVEAYRVKWCLKDAKKRYHKHHVIIVKDTSISDASSDRIADVVSAAINKGGWDVCYLSKWLDRCDMYTDKKPINGTMTTLTKTMAPNGLQAVVFSPEGRDMVLGDHPLKNGDTFQVTNKSLGHHLHDHIINGQMEATATVPNLINFDMNEASKPSDYLKSQECLSPPETPQTPVPAAKQNLAEAVKSNGWFWFWLLLIIVLLILFFLWLIRTNRI